MLGKPCWSSYEMYPISGYFSKLGAHLTMLMDDKRVQFYEKALKKTIIPNVSVVLDIGTGTGILAMIAARCGAKKVYAIENGDIINIAKKLVNENGLEKKINFVRGMSTEIELPEKVDIIVSETMGFTGLEENIEEIMKDARKRFGKEHAILIPDKINVFVALCTDCDVREKLINVWNEPFYGFNYSFLSKLSQQNIFTRQKISDDKIISKPAIIYTTSLGDDIVERNIVSLEVEHDAKIEGLAGWFNVSSQGSIFLHDSKISDNGHWQQFFIPFEKPIEAKKCDKFEIQLLKNEHFFCWSVLYSKNNETKERFLINNDTIPKVLKGIK